MRPLVILLALCAGGCSFVETYGNARDAQSSSVSSSAGGTSGTSSGSTAGSSSSGSSSGNSGSTGAGSSNGGSTGASTGSSGTSATSAGWFTSAVCTGAGAFPSSANADFPLSSAQVPNVEITGDFNRDGHLDLVTGSDTTLSVNLLLGNGDGSFRMGGSEAVSAKPTAMATGDFNGDGLLDLAVATDTTSSPSNVSVFLGQGDGTFQPAVGLSALSDYPGSLVAADFNRDGKLDLAVGVQQEVDLLLGNGDGTFLTASKAVGTASLLSGVAAGDFHRDGHLDLAVTDGLSVDIYAGRGDGTFDPLSASYAPCSSDPEAITVVDLNRDGMLDLVTTQLDQPTLCELLGQGDGGFGTGPTVAIGLDTSSVVAADFNGDGLPDLATGSFAAGAGQLADNLAQENGTFSEDIFFRMSTDIESVIAADFNGDGQPDLATIANGTDVLTFLNPGPAPSGDFSSAHLSYSVRAQSAVTGDFNRDGWLDLVTTYGSVDAFSIQLGGPTGFGAPIALPLIGSGLRADALATGDLDGDGVLDLVVGHLNSDAITGGVKVLHGYGDGGFASPVDVNGGVPAETVATGDWNGDGLLDIAFATIKGSPDLDVFVGQRGGGFQQSYHGEIDGAIGRFLVPADVNGDGKLDLVATGLNEQTLDNVYVFLGDGAGSFSGPARFSLGNNGGTAPQFIPVTTGDFNRDGKLDIAAAVDDSTKKVAVLLGGDTSSDGGLSFTDGGSYTVTGSPDSIVAGDFNRDGVLDLATTNQSSGLSLSVLWGHDDGSFTAAPTLFPPGNGAFQVLAGDFNRDGHLDLMSVDDDVVNVYLNHGCGP